MADEGTGTTIAFLTFSGEVVNINAPDAEVESIDTTHLGTTGGKSSMPATLPEVSDVEITAHFETGVNIPALRAEGTVLITYPDDSSSTWSRAGWVKKISSPEAVVGNKLVITITFETHGLITTSY